jgi:hypothetical protein
MRRRGPGRVALVLGLALAAGCGAGGGPAAPDQPDQAGIAPAVAPVVIDPLVSGWSPARSPDMAAVYDVPPDWRVRPEGTALSIETAPGKGVSASGVALLGSTSCEDPSYWIGATAVMYESDPDLAAAAANAARAWGHHQYLDDQKRAPELTVGAPEKITTLAGQPAVTVAVQARPASRIGSCRISRGVVHAIAATGYRGKLGPTAILVVITDLGRSDTVPDTLIRQILTTLRPDTSS